jgi:transcription-repair coupling factor (superfamily II helicase)
VKRIEIPSSEPSLFLPNFPQQAVASFIADTWLGKEYDVCIIIGDSISNAEELGEDVTALAEHFKPDGEFEFHLYDSPTTTTNPDFHDRVCDRLAALSALRNSAGVSKSKEKIIISATFDSILSPCPILKDQKKSEVFLQCGASYSFSDLIEQLGSTLDYTSEVVCEEPGQFAVRGGLIDIFPVNCNYPVRVDFFGDEVEDIRVFDPSNQRTTHKLEELRISSLDQNDKLKKEGEFFKYLPDSVFWYIHEPENALQRHPLAMHDSTLETASKASFSLAWQRSYQAKDFYLGVSEINGGSGIFINSESPNIKVAPFIDPLSITGNSLSRNIEVNKARPEKILSRLINYSDSGFNLIFAIGAPSEKDRILSFLDEFGAKNIAPTIIEVGLRDGFVYEKNSEFPSFSNWMTKGMNGFVLVTSREIFGRDRSRRPLRSRKSKVYRREVDHALDFSELVQGDHLVHLQHGVCIFQSLGQIDRDDSNEEAITVEFADGVLLHVPLQESHLLSRYVGLKRSKPKLAKLGGKSWSNARRSAELAALDLAADLLRMQAKRDSEKGHAFSPDDRWQKEFEDSFPYTETPDQLSAIQNVKTDMESDKPMDHLVCGDVGYGKTEVALRAAFKAVMDGKQVALLCPTTILCQQHFRSFTERMSDFPVCIEMLSRFRSKSSQKEILLQVKSGAIDILIGTHRLLGKDIEFNDLGLIVIDEEQRFGVEHKEKLKQFRAQVDVLTLSATPIPRTLYFAMIGARSFTTIETPPSNRRPIRTEVLKNSQLTISRAVETEARRGGQIFYLYNKVKTIESVAKRLSIQFPNLRICVGHGQMAEGELEQVMTQFVAGDIDILVCTTIIESGLDIPNCNTIIIDGADKFGLSQLYQLRGRVGRFTRQAYAYLLVNENMPVANKAKKRLSALRQSKSTGAGYRIALRDLELRGAGNLLGSEQSGHVAGVGFEMYCRLLKESVSRLKGDPKSLRPVATVKLDFTCDWDNSTEAFSHQNRTLTEAFLPADYIPEARLRIEAYRKLATLLDVEEIKEFEEELNDRFGSLPKSVQALLMENEIRCLAEQAELDKVEVSEDKLFLRQVKRGPNKEQSFLRKAGKIPQLSSKDGFLKLKEIISFLKIHQHGKNFR